MSYSLPELNLRCNIWTCPVPNIPSIPSGPPREADVPCQLTYGRRVQVGSTGGTTTQGIPLVMMSLLLAAGQDIRGPQDTISQDVVEVPAGSGRWYGVYAVDDIGKGFANEHRTAGILAIAGTWTAPYA